MSDYAKKMAKHDARNRLVGAVLNLVSARVYADLDASDPGWHIEYSEDNLDEAVREYMEHIDA